MTYFRNTPWFIVTHHIFLSFVLLDFTQHLLQHFLFNLYSTCSVCVFASLFQYFFPNKCEYEFVDSSLAGRFVWPETCRWFEEYFSDQEEEKEKKKRKQKQKFTVVKLWKQKPTHSLPSVSSLHLYNTRKVLSQWVSVTSIMHEQWPVQLVTGVL